MAGLRNSFSMVPSPADDISLWASQLLLSASTRVLPAPSTRLSAIEGDVNNHGRFLDSCRAAGAFSRTFVWRGHRLTSETARREGAAMRFFHGPLRLHWRSLDRRPPVCREGSLLLSIQWKYAIGRMPPSLGNCGFPSGNIRFGGLMRILTSSWGHRLGSIGALKIDQETVACSQMREVSLGDVWHFGGTSSSQPQVSTRKRSRSLETEELSLAFVAMHAERMVVSGFFLPPPGHSVERSSIRPVLP